MSSKVVIQRLSTGVPGLDEVLGGGLPEFSFNLIAGLPGCGKTTLAHQIMFALATPERSAIYFTVLGEPPLKMLRYQQQFSFFRTEAVNRSVRFINLSQDALAGELDRALQRIADEVTQHRPALVFVDSFRSVVLASEGQGQRHHSLQQFVQQLGMVLTSWQATTFLIGEYFDEKDANPVFAISDGLIWLRQSVHRNSMVRKMEVLKMRGQDSLPGLHSFRISDDGFQVYPPAGIGAHKTTDAATALDDASHQISTALAAPRLKMGVPGLDAMLGGGLPRGYSLLVAGPSGSGKSILAAAFLAEGARSGETGVIVAFEQDPNRSRGRIVADLIQAGTVGLVNNESSDGSIDEVMFRLLREIRRLDASRVVIDSLSGFELTLAPTFRTDFRESLSRLVTTLAELGLSVLMTSELEDRYTDLRFSPYGTAFMTDAIIVQRYVEVDSRLRRVMAVVKVRASAHSNELREYRVGDAGIELGEMLSHQDGLLGGSPTREVGATSPDDAAPAQDMQTDRNSA